MTVYSCTCKPTTIGRKRKNEPCSVSGIVADTPEDCCFATAGTNNVSLYVINGIKQSVAVFVVLFEVKH